MESSPPPSNSRLPRWLIVLLQAIAILVLLAIGYFVFLYLLPYIA